MFEHTMCSSARYAGQGNRTVVTSKVRISLFEQSCSNSKKFKSICSALRESGLLL